MIFVCCKFGFEKCLGASSQSNHGASCHIKSTFCCTSQSDQEIVHRLLCRTKDDNTSTWHFFFIFVSSWGSHLSSFFTFSICFKHQMTLEWLMVSSSATSHVVIRGSASMIALHWSLSTYDDWPLCSNLQGSCLLCKTSWTNTAWYIC